MTPYIKLEKVFLQNHPDLDERWVQARIAEDPLTCVVRGTGRILDDYEKYRSVLSV